MIYLKANITLKSNDNKYINKRNVTKYLERICAKFVGESIDEFEFCTNSPRCFNMNFRIFKNNLDCKISCNSYEKILQITQGILRLENIVFLNCRFEVNSLELKELNEVELVYNIANSGTY
ncbi:hypothetical protein [Clostridium thailandense]|uniref:Uncharacterized protein n=1 Tax=Clostridium thailandense TaxID=2794346 RepID=A0A949TVY9_9CLOT|nr:hypothetical protein [Clostridium thailandense]MBV7274556.1 hypothetical protein [Clostridium thailandense]